MTSSSRATRRYLPDDATFRRWHFYAGLFCLPFFCWLAVTGSIYVFRPQVEAWLDRPYENLPLEGPRALPSREASAAGEAVPGSSFSHYEPPATPNGAAQVVVTRDGRLYRVYVHPGTLRAMEIVQDDHRLMDRIASLHGELLLGARGSMLVELAGSWGIVMILTGLYLWLPRGRWRLAGLVYPRLGQRGRPFWRDLHSVSGLWISVVTLLLLLSGMPWSANWGSYLGWVRDHWAATRGALDWPIGGTDPTLERAGPASEAAAAHGMSGMSGMSAAEMASMAPPPVDARRGGLAVQRAFDLDALDRMVPLAARLRLPRPVWISPPADGVSDWTISSHAQDRPARVTYTVASDRGVVTGKQGFGDLNVVDQVVNVSIAAHEGQLFGWLNQAILLLNAAGVLTVTISATVLWLRRRPGGSLGAPVAGTRSGFSMPLLAAIVALAVLLPSFGLSLLLVLAMERTVLRRVPSVRQWLGLMPVEA